jgi:hypothetical protein
MVGWGIFLIILGAGSLLLPMIGFQFQLMDLLDDFQPYAGIVVAIIGAVLVFMGQRSTGEVAVSRDPAPSSDPNRNDPAASG